ncbi:MFS transporter [Sphingomonas morindae]|uniref:MFS transporter n=1 Tax=Sphingomonas morindae TaxID=1541170 RepID=A0ABY4XD71_9SPHN|nr:MFS transporter [Sphingomonas morindae]USI74919.1 MFS transporter [Sphingomonas morindae]
MALAFAAIILNYVDRQMLALLKPSLQAEFGWSERAYGHMASAFQFASALAFLGAGWLIDRLGLRRGFALGVATWSLAAMAHALVASVAGFIGVRALLGAAEAIGTPAQVKTAATYFPERQRTLMLGIGNMASNLGAVAAPLAIPPLALAFGWRAAFLLAGGLGLVWVTAWLAVPAPAPVARPPAETARRPALRADRRLAALIAAKMFSDNVWWFLLFFTPDLFHRRFGLSQGALGAPVALVYAMAALGALAGGWFPARLRARGVSLDRARKAPMLACALLILAAPAVLLTASPWAGAALLGLALFAHQGFSTNVFALATDLFAPDLVGRAIGIAAFAGNLAGMAMIEAAGWSLDRGHGYAPLLIATGGSYLIGLALVQLCVPRLAPAPPTAG